MEHLSRRGFSAQNKAKDEAGLSPGENDNVVMHGKGRREVLILLKNVLDPGNGPAPCRGVQAAALSVRIRSRDLFGVRLETGCRAHSN
jgi:hypothetical protein